jgi:hypothetical protein
VVAAYHVAVATKLVETISLDTQVFVATGFGFGGKSFESPKKHFASRSLARCPHETAEHFWTACEAQKHGGG